VCFGAPEALWGCTPGKFFTRLRVRTRRTNDRPGPLQAALRAGWFCLFWLGPVELTLALLFLSAPATGRGGGRAGGGADVALVAALPLLMSVPGAVLIASTMRRHNGYRGLHELLSDTRTIRLPEQRPRFRMPARAAPPAPAAPPHGVPRQVGSFLVRGVIRADDAEVVLHGEDAGLRRPVWLWLRRGGEALPAARREVARGARPRWLAGGEQDGWRWEAFVASPGCPLAELVPRGRPLLWAEMLAVLAPLAEELYAAERDGTQPPRLGPGQVWAHPGGRVQLLDMAVAAGPDAGSPLALLRQAAAVGLEGRPRAEGDMARPIAAPVPGHAAAFLARLMGAGAPFTSVAEARAGLAETAEGPSEITRPARALQTALSGVALAPGLVILYGLGPAYLLSVWFGVVILESAATNLQQGARRARAVAAVEVVSRPDLLGRLTAAARLEHQEQRAARLERYARGAGEVREGWMLSWSGPMRRGLARTEEQQRRYVDTVLADDFGGAPSGVVAPDFDLSEPNELAVGLARENIYRPRGLMAALVAAWPLLWAVWAALTRGGLANRLAGVRLLGADGRPAARWRCALRSLLVWAPPTLLVVLSVRLELWRLVGPGGRPAEELLLFCAWASWASWWLAVVLLPAYVVLALRRPNGGPHDRLAGTYPVPR
jgi:hypothetical protein